MTWTKRQGIQLCYPFEVQRLEKWHLDYVIVQPKLDGDRCRCVVDESGIVTLLSSEENIFESVPHIVEQIQNLGLKNIELDGELYTHNTTHQAIHGAVSRTRNIHPEFESIEYRVFDIISDGLQVCRLEKLKSLGLETPNIKTVPFNVVPATEDEIISAMLGYITDKYEGVIIRHPYAEYVRKRSTNVMKFKPRKEDSYTIVGFEEEISIHGDPKNSLGALILKSDQNETFKVGSGSFLTRENRIELWKNRSELLGQIAVIKYQHLTERQVPRFPVLIEVVEPYKPSRKTK